MNIAQRLEQRGMQQGIQEGMEQGIQQEKLRIAKEILAKLRLDMKTVVQATGLGEKELMKL